VLLIVALSDDSREILGGFGVNVSDHIFMLISIIKLGIIKLGVIK
jgi:hypothetical protein